MGFNPVTGKADTAMTDTVNHFGSDRYSSVSVTCADPDCSAASKLRGKRFLESEAPSLPLPGCTADSCSCRYVPRKDRRDFLSNRRFNVTLEPGHDGRPVKKDRRRGPDRRKVKLNLAATCFLSPEPLLES
jgi:hypothetical protein